MRPVHASQNIENRGQLGGGGYADRGTVSAGQRDSREIGVPVYYIMPQNARRSASFDSFLVEKDSLEIVISNAGNVHLRISGEAIISTFDTRIVQQDSLTDFVVLPGKQRRLKIGIDEKLEQGGYLAKVILDYGAVELIVGERKFYK